MAEHGCLFLFIYFSFFPVSFSLCLSLSLPLSRSLPLSLPDSRMCKRLSDAQQSITEGFDIAFPVITLTVINSALCVVNNE